MFKTYTMYHFGAFEKRFLRNQIDLIVFYTKNSHPGKYPTQANVLFYDSFSISAIAIMFISKGPFTFIERTVYFHLRDRT